MGIGDAAKKLSEDAYPFMKEVNWNSYLYLTKPGSASAAEWAKAIDKMILMGATMDPDLLKKATLAHHKAIGSVTEANPVMSKADFEAINAGIGRLIASVPESQTMDVYNSVAALVPAEMPPYLMSTVKEADAKKAYEAFLKFKDVVKANPITPQLKETPSGLSSKFGSIEAAAAKLSDASYPFIKSAPWDSDIYLKPLPGVSRSQVMDVFNAMAKVTGSSVPNNLFSMSAPSEATAAYDAFLQFKDVVKAAQR